MKTDQQLLEEYTELINAEWKNITRKDRIKKELEANAKEDTKRLRVAIRRLIRNTTWTLEHCAYWPLINHAERPVTSRLQGRLELYHFRENPRSLMKMEINFDPADEERTLLYLESIINSTNP